MVYKRIKRGGGAKGAGKRGGPNDKGTFKNDKIGQDTARKMQDKLGKLRASKQNAADDEEIRSNDSDAYIDKEPTKAGNSKRNELVDDPFLQDAAG